MVATLPSNPSRHSQHPILRAEKRHLLTAFDFKKKKRLTYRAPAAWLKVPLQNEILGRKNERLGDTRFLFDGVNGRLAVSLFGFSGVAAGIGSHSYGRLLVVLLRLVDNFASAPHPLSI